MALHLDTEHCAECARERTVRDLSKELEEVDLNPNTFFDFVEAWQHFHRAPQRTRRCLADYMIYTPVSVLRWMLPNQRDVWPFNTTAATPERNAALARFWERPPGEAENWKEWDDLIRAGYPLLAFGVEDEPRPRAGFEFQI